jgi:hypothetical protein
MLGLCAVSALALGAVGVSSAWAAKEPNLGYGQFKTCPVNTTIEVNEEIIPMRKCVHAWTRPGEGGYYTVGGITVKIKKSIKLQGALSKAGDYFGYEAVNIVVPPEGEPAIVPAGEVVPGEPIGHVSLAEQEELGWPQALKESYALAQKHHKFIEGKVTEWIEPAGNDPDLVSETNLVGESSEPGIVASIQIQGKNKWLEELGGNCFIGSEAEPIVQRLATGSVESPLTHEIITGVLEELQFGHEGRNVAVPTELVDNRYAVPGATGCGGPAYEAYLDPAVNHAFGIPAVAGASQTRLIGELDSASAVAIKSHFGL